MSRSLFKAYRCTFTFVIKCLFLISQEVQPSSDSSSRDPPELLPRLCLLTRSDTGYGFNLHSERSKPGQYMRALDPGSPADRAGLKPQDRLIEVRDGAQMILFLWLLSNVQLPVCFPRIVHIKQQCKYRQFMLK